MAKKYTLLSNTKTGRSVRNNQTGVVVVESENPSLYLELRKKAVTAQKRMERDEIAEMCGLTKVRGNVSGKIYYE